jgi:hypothetical protein
LLSNTIVWQRAGSIGSHVNPGWLGLPVREVGGCKLAAKANRLPWRESSIIGVMMNLAP